MAQRVRGDVRKRRVGFPASRDRSRQPGLVASWRASNRRDATARSARRVPCPRKWPRVRPRRDSKVPPCGMSRLDRAHMSAAADRHSVLMKHDAAAQEIDIGHHDRRRSGADALPGHWPAIHPSWNPKTSLPVERRPQIPRRQRMPAHRRSTRGAGSASPWNSILTSCRPPLTSEPLGGGRRSYAARRSPSPEGPPTTYVAATPQTPPRNPFVPPATRSKLATWDTCANLLPGTHAVGAPSPHPCPAAPPRCARFHALRIRTFFS